MQLNFWLVASLISLLFFIHYVYGYDDFLLVGLFLFIFIKFETRIKPQTFLLISFFLISYYVTRYFILFESWTMFFFLPLIFFFLFLKKEYFGKVYKLCNRFSPLVTLITFIFVIFVLYKSGIFFNEPLVMNDYPYHFYRAWLVSEFLIPNYGTIIGYVPYFQAGYVELYDYPPGGFILTYLIRQFTFKTLSIELAFRIIVFFSFILSIFAVYFFSYKFTKIRWVATLSSIFWVAWTHYYFIEGWFTGYYSLSFSLFSLALYKCWQETEDLKYFFLSSLFSGLTFLFHPQIFLNLLLSLVIFHFVYFREEKLSYLLFLIFTSLMIGSIYIVEIINGLKVSQVSWENQVKVWPQMFDLPNIFLNEYLYQTTLPLFSVIFLSAYFYLTKKSSKLQKIFTFFVLNIILLVIFMFSLYFIQMSYPRFPFVILRPQIFSASLRIFFIVLSSFLIIITANNLTKRTTRINRTMMGAMLSLILIFIIPNIAYFFNTLSSSNYSQFKRVYWGNNFQDVYQLNFTKGIFRFEPKSGFLELMNWIKKLDTGSRILVEDSTTRKLGGHVLGLLPIYTNKTFIGGPFPFIQVAKDDRNVYEGYFFGKHIESYTAEEMEEKLEKYNVRYIAVWSIPAISFFDSKPQTFQKIFITSDNLFHVYGFKLTEDNKKK
jgi:hypothetical protein